MEFKNLSSFNPSVCINGQIARIYRITNSIFRKHISPFGITTSQLSLLFICAKMHDLNQRKLATIAQLEKSSLNRNLRRLVSQGLLTKDNFPVIRITTKGKQLVENVIPSWEKAMQEIKSKLGEDGVAHIQSIHQILTSNKKG